MHEHSMASHAFKKHLLSTDYVPGTHQKTWGCSSEKKEIDELTQ